MATLSKKRVRVALALAMLADLAQLGLFPLFSQGAASPFNDVLDTVVAVVLFLMLGWHWALLPSIVLEMVPALNLVPTWTAAVLFVTRGTRHDLEADLPAVKRVGEALGPGVAAARLERGGEPQDPAPRAPGR
jgi:hypothetical protein